MTQKGAAMMNLLTEDFIKNNIPRLGFGAMRLPTKGSNADIDIEETKKMVDYYMDNGMNYFDTAYFYHEGSSENAMKEAVVKRYPRESFILADKLPIWHAETAEDIPKLFNEQLERCGVDYFDFYLLHALDGEKNTKCEELAAYEYCLKMKEAGKIKFLGFSFHGSPKDLRHILSNHPELEFVQLQLNYYDWEFPYKKCYEIAREYKLPIILMEPIRGGFLAKLPPAIEKIFTEINPNVSIASWAMRFSASLDGVITILSGMSALEHVKDNVAHMKDYQPLTTVEEEAIKKVAKALIDLPTVPCTDCKYCAECPAEIPIFDIFNIYNEFVNDKQKIWQFHKDYREIDANRRADACVACGVCEPVCPQKIEIIERLAEIAALT